MKRISCYLLVSLQVLCFWFASMTQHAVAAPPQDTSQLPSLYRPYDTHGTGTVQRQAVDPGRRVTTVQDLLARQQQPHQASLPEETRWIMVVAPAARAKQAIAAKTLSETVAVVSDQFTDHRGRLVALVEPSADRDINAAKRLLAAKAGGAVTLVKANTYQLYQTPTDPLYPRQYGLKNNLTSVEFDGPAPRPGADIDIERAWQTTVGSHEVVVAVVDSGVDLQHPDLQANLWVNAGEIAGNGLDDDGNGWIDDVHGYDFAADYTSEDADPDDESGHGTHVAGIIGAAAGNGLGGRGVNQNVSIMAVKAFSNTGFTTDYHLAKAVNYAVANGADIINASWGGTSPSDVLKQALVDAGEAGVLVAIAAGNESQQIGNGIQFLDAYPAAYQLENTITVAATDGADALASYSNFGRNNVHLAAPGSTIYSTFPPQRVVFAEDFETVAPGELPAEFGDGGGVWHVARDGHGPAGNHALRAAGNRAATLTLPTVILPDPGETDLLAESLLVHMSVMGDFAAGGHFVWETRQGDNGSWKPLIRYDAGAVPYHEHAYYNFQFPLFLSGSERRLAMRLTYEPADADDTTFGIELDNLVIYSPSAAVDPAVDYRHAYQPLSGTSMATPFVAGVAALLLADKPDLSPAALKMHLIASGDEVAGLAGLVGSGRRLDAGNALNASGGLALLSDLAAETVRLGEQYPLVWHNYADPDGVTELVLLQNGNVVADAGQDVTRSGGLFNWRVPEVAPGTYQLVLRAGGQQSEPVPVTIHAAQEVQVPDAALRAWLGGTFDVNGDDRLVTQELETFQGYLRVPSRNIKDYTGLEHFRGVRTLQLNYNRAVNLPDYSGFPHLETLVLSGVRVATLPDFPASLTTLQLDNMPVTALPALPTGINTLSLENLRIRELPPLPRDVMRYVGLSQLPLQRLDALPATLDDLGLFNMPLEHIGVFPERVFFQTALVNLALRQLPALTGSYVDLFVHGLPITHATGLAEASIFSLSLNHNPRLVRLDALPARLNNLSVNNNRLRELPALPGGLQTLSAQGNLLTTLPALPDSLTTLRVDNNLLTNLPSMPAELSFLTARDNQISALPTFTGQRLLEIDLAANALTTLPVLFQPYLFKLDVSRNQLTEIPPLAGRITEIVDLSHNQLRRLPSLRELPSLLYFNASHNLLTDIPSFNSDRLAAVHLQGNSFGADACAAVAELQAMDLGGVALTDFGAVKGKLLDPLLVEPNRDGSRLGCDGAADNLPVQDLTFFRLSHDQVQITWRGGVAGDAVMRGYQFYLDYPGQPGRLIGTYHENQIVFPAAAFRPNTLISIVPLTDAVRPRYDLMGRITVTAEDLVNVGNDFAEHTFPATDSLGEAVATVVVSGRAGNEEIGFGVLAYDADGLEIARGYAATVAYNRAHVFQLDRVFDSAIRAQAARYSVIAAHDCRVRVETAGNGHGSALEAALTGQTSGLAPFIPGQVQSETARWLVMNPSHISSGDAQVTLEVRDAAQTLLAVKHLNLAHGATAVWRPRDWVPAEIAKGSALSLSWTSDVPLVLWDHRLDHRDDVIARGFLARGHRNAALRGTFHTLGKLVHVANPNPFPTLVHFTARRPNGTVLVARALAVPAYTSIHTEVANHLLTTYQGSANPLGTYMTFVADHPVYLSLESDGTAIGSVGGPSVLGYESLIAQTESGWVLSAADLKWDDRYESQLHIVNLEDRDQEVTCVLYNEAGERINLLVTRVAAKGAVVIGRDRLLQDLALSDWSEPAFIVVFSEQNTKLQGFQFDFDKIEHSYTAKPMPIMY